MTYVLYVCLAGILVGMGVVIARLQRGPTNLDRAVALDVITSAVVGTVIIIMALTGRIDLLPLLVVLSSVAFISSTTIARFAQAESISERRILTPAEAATEAEPRFGETDAPVHPDADEIISTKSQPGDHR